MLALTLKHPWPFAVCRLEKRIENRTWAPRRQSLPVGEWFAIHGGAMPRRYDLKETAYQARALIAAHRKALVLAEGEDVTLRDVLGYRGVVAVCRFGGIVRNGESGSEDPWFEGPIGWRLEKLVVLPEPVPCPGSQGLWPLPEVVLASVREQYRRALSA